MAIRKVKEFNDKTVIIRGRKIIRFKAACIFPGYEVGLLWMNDPEKNENDL